MTKLVIFDLDGVLIDSKDYHYEALNQALGDEYAIYGFSGYGREGVEYYRIKEFSDSTSRLTNRPNSSI